MNLNEEILLSLKVLDKVVHEKWGVHLLYQERSTETPLHVIASSVVDGFDLNIGGNAFQFLSKRYVSDVQYMFSDICDYTDKKGFAIASAQDLHPIYVSQEDLTVWGALAGGSKSWSFGKSIPQFLDLLRECFVLCEDVDVYREKLDLVEDILRKYPEVDQEGWIEYFYN